MARRCTEVSSGGMIGGIGQSGALGKEHAVYLNAIREDITGVNRTIRRRRAVDGEFIPDVSRRVDDLDRWRYRKTESPCMSNA